MRRALSRWVGLALVLLAVPLGHFLTGCVPAVALRTSLREAIDAQGEILDGVDGLDDMCQAAQHAPEGLARCRQYRQLAAHGLRRQVTAVSSLVR